MSDLKLIKKYILAITEQRTVEGNFFSSTCLLLHHISCSIIDHT